MSNVTKGPQNILFLLSDADGLSECKHCYNFTFWVVLYTHTLLTLIQPFYTYRVSHEKCVKVDTTLLSMVLSMVYMSTVLVFLFLIDVLS